MSGGNIKCPICDLDGSLVRRFPRHDRDVDDIECARCGKFMSCPSHMSFDWDSPVVPQFLLQKGLTRRDAKQASLLVRRYLSIYTRECSERGLPAPLINPFDPKELSRLAETYADTSPALKPDKLLRLLARRTANPGAPASFNPQLDYPAVHGVNPTEFVYYLKALAQGQLIETSAFAKTPGVDRDPERIGPGDKYVATITLEGWSKLGATGSASRSAFVAMSFDPSLESAFCDGIAPAITAAGYEPLRVDRMHHNEKICDRIVAEIRRSRFVIADVTMQRQGVYFEAGFAMALGLPVIWCCRKDDFSNVHFDTRQYNHIVWEQPADLREQLRDRVQATIGTVR